MVLAKSIRNPLTWPRTVAVAGVAVTTRCGNAHRGVRIARPLSTLELWRQASSLPVQLAGSHYHFALN